MTEETKKTKGLGRKMSILFIIVLVVTLAVVGLFTYFNQMDIIKTDNEENLRQVADYLGKLIEADGEEFLDYSQYFMDHYAEVNIPIRAKQYLTFQTKYEQLFHEHHPGKTLGVDIEFEELDSEVKNAWLIYTHLYWLLTFEEAREAFGMPYTYFLLPDEETRTVVYMIDGERTSRLGHLKVMKNDPGLEAFYREQGDEADYMYLADTYYNSLEENELMWTTWETGKEQSGFRVWHNEWGDTYSCYVPVWINGEKIGLVAAEVNIADVDAAILRSTARQLALVALVMIACFVVLILLISKRYISKLIRLKEGVEHFTFSKDSSVVTDIEKCITGTDEISALSKETISMILEIENHIRNLREINEELYETKDAVGKMQSLAHRDALTGVLNRTAYNNEVRQLEKEIRQGLAQFALVMVDLNYLKQINDDFGHEKGNYSIKHLCDILLEAFPRSPLFRIGGDEFVVLLKGNDYRNRVDLVRALKDRFAALQKDESLELWQKSVASVGMASFDEFLDSGVDSVFKRADLLMYENKKAMKASRE